MAQLIGTVKQIRGFFYAKDSDGETRVLKAGDQLFAGETVIGDSSNGAQSSITFALSEGGREYTVVANDQLMLDNALLAEGSTSQPADMEESSMLGATYDNTQEAAVTAAGDEVANAEDIENLEETAAAGTTEVDALEGRFADRTGDEVNITTDLRDATFPAGTETVAATPADEPTPEVEVLAEVEPNLPPTIVVDAGNPEGANDVVYESGLAAGSDSGSDTEFAYGTFTVADPNGLENIQSVTINGIVIPVSQLGNNNVITTSTGTLTVTGYDSATGVAQYQYELTSATTDVDNVEEADQFILTTTDGELVSQPATITISIVDDMPTITVSAAGEESGLIVDETVLANNATADFSTNFSNTPIPGADGVASISTIYLLGVAQSGANSGLVDSQTKEDVLLRYNETSGKVEGYTQLGGEIVFTLSVDASGSVTLDQLRAVVHTDVSQANEGTGLLSDDLITLTRTDTITDNDGDSSSDFATINIGSNISFLDDGPSISASNAIGPVNELSYSGLIDLSGGADQPATISIDLNGVKVGDSVIENYTTTLTYDSADELYHGSFTYNNEVHNFTLDLDSTNGTYTLNLEGTPTIVEIGSTESMSFDQKGSGPTTSYEISYLDSDTDRVFTATATPVSGESIPLSFLSYSGSGDVSVDMISASGVNASSNGIGIDNNLLNSSYDKHDGVFTTESFIYDPTDPAASITLDFTGGGNNEFKGDDSIYLKVDGFDSTGTAVSQNILLSAAHGDYLWDGSDWTSIDTTSYSGGELSSYTVSANDLFGADSSISNMQVTAGYEGTETTEVKVEFGFAAITETTIAQELQMDFTATITDSDNDISSVDFIVATDADSDIMGTDEDDFILGSAADDTIDGGEGSDVIVAGAGDDTIEFDSDDLSIDGGAGTDTLIVDNGSTLDFSTLGDGKVSNIENLDFRGGSETTVTNLTVESVFDMTNDNNVLHLLGNDTDRVQIDDSQWTSNGTTEVNGITYNQYQGSFNDGTVDQTVILNVQDTIDEEIV